MTEDNLKSTISWWESKRWIFNFVVGLFGALGVYTGLSRYAYSWTMSDTLGIIIWGIGANIFYSLGLLVELYVWYYISKDIKINNGLRYFFFVGGTIFSCLWTFWNAMDYFHHHYYF